MNNLSLSLKVCPIDYLGQVIHELLIVDLLVKVTRIFVKCHLKTTSGMTMSEIQMLIGPDRILTLGHLLRHVADTVILDVLKK
jgi:hypothetical protein